jgi:hypothetical protein
VNRFRPKKVAEARAKVATQGARLESFKLELAVDRVFMRIRHEEEQDRNFMYECLKRRRAA